MKKPQKLFSVLFLFFIISCAPSISGKNPIHYPDRTGILVAKYPTYRLDREIKKIVIVGSGPQKSVISPWLARLFIQEFHIKVIEDKSLKSLLGGKIIEHDTDLTRNDAQLIAQSFQTNYLLSFKEEYSPNIAHTQGGRMYGRVTIKIVDFISGEVQFQTIKEVGQAPDLPDKYGYSGRPADSTEMTAFLEINLSNLLFELYYAFGKVAGGTFPNRNVKDKAIIWGVFLDSPAYKAGIKAGDELIEFEGHKIGKWSDFRVLPDKRKQGDTVKMKIRRNGDIFDLEYTYPEIPFYPAKDKKPRHDIASLSLGNYYAQTSAICLVISKLNASSLASFF